MSGITEVPQQFRTSDGQKYPTKAAAERAQALIDARKEFEGARKRLGRVLAESQITKDGEPFRLARAHRYWRIQYTWEGWPRLEEVAYLGLSYGSEFSLDDDELEIVEMKQELGQGCDLYRRRSYRISELYADRKAADAAVTDEQEKFVRAQAETYPALRERLGLPREVSS